MSRSGITAWMKGAALRRAGRAIAAVFVAAAVNLALFWVLAQLNRVEHRPAEREPEREVRYVVRDTTEKQTRQPESREPERTEPREVMQIDTSRPKPEPIQAEPVPVAPEMPEPAVVPVSVQPAETSREPSQPTASPNSSGESSLSSGGSSSGDLAAPSQSFRAETVDQPPREISAPSPRYPRRALRRGMEGEVVVRLLIDREGRVEDAQLVRVEGPGSFGEAVMDVVERWRFEPARHQGRRVRVWGVKTVRFELGR